MTSEINLGESKGYRQKLVSCLTNGESPFLKRVSEARADAMENNSRTLRPLYRRMDEIESDLEYAQKQVQNGIKKGISAVYAGGSLSCALISAHIPGLEPLGFIIGSLFLGLALYEPVEFYWNVRKVEDLKVEKEKVKDDIFRQASVFAEELKLIKEVERTSLESLI